MNNNTLKIESTFSDWENEMIADIASKHNVSENDAMDIGLTFLVNEITASINGHDCIMNAINVALMKSNNSLTNNPIMTDDDINAMVNDNVD